MEFVSKFERVEADDPNRCQHIIPTIGQCLNKACEGSKYCPAHGGNKGFQAQQKKNLRNYRLNKFKIRVNELSDSDVILSLKEEIGILRLLMEEKINCCQDEHDLILMAGPLSDLAMKVEKVVTSCNRLDSKLDNLLSKEKILQFAQTVVAIIGKYVDEEIIEKISDDIMEAL